MPLLQLHYWNSYRHFPTAQSNPLLEKILHWQPLLAPHKVRWNLAQSIWSLDSLKGGENHENATITTAAPQGRWTHCNPASKIKAGSRCTVVSNTFYQKQHLSRGGYIMQILSVGSSTGWIAGAVGETGYLTPFICLCKEHIRKHSRVYRLSISASKALPVLFHMGYLSGISLCILWIQIFNLENIILESVCMVTN